jgi:hypothetical protein
MGGQTRPTGVGIVYPGMARLPVRRPTFAPQAFARVPPARLSWEDWRRMLEATHVRGAMGLMPMQDWYDSQQRRRRRR